MHILGPFASSAPYTVGTEADYKHFLPRILEIALEEDGWSGFEKWAIATKLDYLKWLEWPNSEIEAVRLFFILGFERAAGIHPDAWPHFDEWLLSNLAIGENTLVQVRRALGLHEKHTMMHLAQFVVMHASHLRRDGNLGGGAWDVVPAGSQKTFTDFLKSDQFKDLLLVHGSKASDEETFNYFSPALDIVEAL